MLPSSPVPYRIHSQSPPKNGPSCRCCRMLLPGHAHYQFANNGAGREKTGHAGHTLISVLCTCWRRSLADAMIYSALLLLTKGGGGRAGRKVKAGGVKNPKESKRASELAALFFLYPGSWSHCTSSSTLAICTWYGSRMGAGSLFPLQCSILAEANSIHIEYARELV